MTIPQSSCTAAVAVGSTWRPAVNGAGKRPWFLASGSDYHFGADGRLVRYATSESAQRAADRLNGLAA